MAPRDAFSPFAATIAGYRIYVYANDHAPPHAHVRLREADCMMTVDLRTGDPLPLDWPQGALREWSQLRPRVIPSLPKMLAEFERLNPPRKDRQ